MRPQANIQFRTAPPILIGLLTLSLLAPSACERKAPQQPPADAAQTPAETTSVFDEPETPAMPDYREVVGLEWDIPEGWEPYDEFRSFRLATWRVDGDNEGIYAFAFFMGPRDNAEGTVESNAIRWALQVQNNDKSKPVPEFTTQKQGSLTITSIRLNGEYVVGMSRDDLESRGFGGSLIGVVIEGGPRGPVFFRLSGPRNRVNTLLPGFNDMLDSIRIIEGPHTP